MTTQEANEIIAKYMGWIILTPKKWSEKAWIGKNEICSDSIKIRYSGSLDSLVPIWEKLHKFGYKVILDQLHVAPFVDIITKGISVTVNEKGTIQEAAAVATAKAIQEMEKDK